MSEDKKHSYIKFYGRDWLGDAMLRMCTPEERGVWIDLLCVMAGAEPYGHLAVNNRAMTDAEVGRVIGLDESTYKGILYRLIEKGIPSKTESGMVFSRRMVKEHKKFITGRTSGLKGGGNPALKINKESKDHIPEAISHIPEAKGGLKVPYIGKSKREQVYDNDFLVFWETYPKKVGKPEAFKQWKIAVRPELADILQAVETQKKSRQWNDDGGKFIPDPERWIKKGRWDDKPTETTTVKSTPITDKNYCHIHKVWNCDECEGLPI
jgi:hypothetical protein